jgi:hypothetical protein
MKLNVPIIYGHYKHFTPLGTTENRALMLYYEMDKDAGVCSGLVQRIFAVQSENQPYRTHLP